MGGGGFNPVWVTQLYEETEKLSQVLAMGPVPSGLARVPDSEESIDVRIGIGDGPQLGGPSGAGGEVGVHRGGVGGAVEDGVAARRDDVQVGVHVGGEGGGGAGGVPGHGRRDAQEGARGGGVRHLGIGGKDSDLRYRFFRFFERFRFLKDSDLILIFDLDFWKIQIWFQILI